MIQMLSHFYGKDASSRFSGHTTVVPKDVDKLTFEQSIAFFLEDFTRAVAIVKEKHYGDVVHLVKAGKLSASALDTYKDEHPISADQI